MYPLFHLYYKILYYQNNFSHYYNISFITLKISCLHKFLGREKDALDWFKIELTNQNPKTVIKYSNGVVGNQK